MLEAAAAERSAAPPAVDALPPDALEAVLSLLSPPELGSVARTCLQWATAARSETLWRALCLRDRPDLAGDTGAWRARYREEVWMRFDGQARHDARAAEARPLPLKLFCVGDARAGKSCFVQRFTYGCSLQVPHRGVVDIKSRTVSAPRWSEVLKLRVFDVADPERFLARSAYRQADGVFFVLDLTDRASPASVLKRVEHMVKLRCFQDRGDDPLRCPAALVLGTRSDVPRLQQARDVGTVRSGDVAPPCRVDVAPPCRVVSAAEGADLARRVSEMLGRRARYAECSSKTGCGVEQAVYALCDAAMQLRADRVAAGWGLLYGQGQGRTGAFLEGSYGHTRGMIGGAAFDKGCCVL